MIHIWSSDLRHIPISRDIIMTSILLYITSISIESRVRQISFSYEQRISSKILTRSVSSSGQRFSEQTSHGQKRFTSKKWAIPRGHSRYFRESSKRALLFLSQKSWREKYIPRTYEKYEQDYMSSWEKCVGKSMDKSCDHISEYHDDAIAPWEKLVWESLPPHHYTNSGSKNMNSEREEYPWNSCKKNSYRSIMNLTKKVDSIFKSRKSKGNKKSKNKKVWSKKRIFLRLRKRSINSIRINRYPLRRK